VPGWNSGDPAGLKSGIIQGDDGVFFQPWRQPFFLLLPAPRRAWRRIGGYDPGFVVPQEREPKPATGVPKDCGLSNRQTSPAFTPSLTQGQIVKVMGLTPLLSMGLTPLLSMGLTPLLSMTRGLQGLSAAQSTRFVPGRHGVLILRILSFFSATPSAAGSDSFPGAGTFGEGGDGVEKGWPIHRDRRRLCG
jgi:hypothetical protein